MNLRNLFRNYSPKQKRLIGYLKSKWGVSIRDISWYEQAVRHKSLIGSGKFCHTDCNERLELLGDAVLDTVITEHLFERFPSKDEGYLTKIRARIVNRQMLGLIGSKAGLQEVIEARIGSDDSMDKITGNALEALIGAIYMDKGFKVAKDSLQKFFLNNYLDLDQVVAESQDHKSALIEWVQQKKFKIQFDTHEDPENEQLFTCKIYLNSEFVSSGTERSKKKAEQAASKQAVKELNL